MELLLRLGSAESNVLLLLLVAKRKPEDQEKETVTEGTSIQGPHTCSGRQRLFAIQ